MKWVIYKQFSQFSLQYSKKFEYLKISIQAKITEKTPYRYIFRYLTYIIYILRYLVLYIFSGLLNIHAEKHFSPGGQSGLDPS